MKKVLSLALVFALCLLSLAGCGNKVSGKYVAAEDEANYYNFMDEGKVEACHLGVILSGDYEIAEEENKVNVNLYVEAFGAKVPVEHKLTINEDGSLTEKLGDIEIVFNKEK